MRPAPLTIRGQRWDTFDAYLFDIDGTLLHCQDAVHYFAFRSALKEMSGQDLNLDGIVVHGNTDIGILRDALSLAGIAEQRWRMQLREATGWMCRHVADHQHDMKVMALPYVHKVLTYLHSRAVLGVATGNLSQIGNIKLDKAELSNFFQILGWSDGFESRREVFRNAVGLLTQSINASLRICIVGDTPNDIEAAHEIGLPCMSVATGIYRREDLSAAGSDLCLSSFVELFVRSERRLRRASATV